MFRVTYQVHRAAADADAALPCCPAEGIGSVVRGGASGSEARREPAKNLPLTAGVLPPPSAPSIAPGSLAKGRSALLFGSTGVAEVKVSEARGVLGGVRAVVP